MITKKCRHTPAQRRRCSCAFYWSGYIDGHREYRNLGPDRAAAKRSAAQIELDLLGGRARRVPRDATLAAVVGRWLEELDQRGRRSQTIKAYRTAANTVERYFGPEADVRGIDADELTRFEDMAHALYRGHGPSHLMQVLRNILNQALREGLIDAVPASRNLPQPVQSKSQVRMSEAESEATIAALSPAHWGDLGELIVLTGLRISEALALRWQDFNQDQGTISVEVAAEQRGRVDAPVKTSYSRRRIRLEDEVVVLLARQPRRGERIFPFAYGAAFRAMRRAMERAGTYKRDRGWHSLRHTNTALRNRANQSIRDAAADLGHGPNFAMTAHYGWASEAAAAPGISRIRHRGDGAAVA